MWKTSSVRITFVSLRAGDLSRNLLPPFFFRSVERVRPWNDINKRKGSLCLEQTPPQIRIHPPHPRAFENLTRANRWNKIQSVVPSFVTMFYLSECSRVGGRGRWREGGGIALRPRQHGRDGKGTRVFFIQLISLSLSLCSLFFRSSCLLVFLIILVFLFSLFR